MKSWIKNVNHLAPLGLSIVLSFSLAACGTKANEPKVQAEQASEKTETESSKKNPVSGNPAEPEDKDKKSTKQKTEQKKQEETILKLQADLKATQESLKNEKEKVKKGIESLEKAQKNLKVAEETLKKLKEQGSAKEGTSEEITFALKAQKQAEADLKIKTTEAEDAKKKLAEAKKTISTLTDALADANKKLIAEEEKNKASPKQAPSPENTSAAPKPFPSEYAQCTDGAIQGKHSGEYQIHTFQSNIHIAVESIKDLHPNNNTFGGAAEASILTRILDLYPTAQYASNAAMFESDGGLSGLLKVDGVTRNKIDFLPHQGQNFGKENSILFHYWAGKRVNSDADHIEIQPLDPNKPLK